MCGLLQSVVYVVYPEVGGVDCRGYLGSRGMVEGPLAHIINAV